MQVTFVHVDGSKKGQSEVVDQPIISVGRDPSNQLSFDPYKDVDVSSRHAQFVAQGEQLLIQDLGSRNGTFLNGQRIGAQPVPVPPTSIIQFGDKGPKVQVTYKQGPAAPGKKTAMIQDLQQQMHAQQKAQAASKGKLVCCFFVVLVLGGGGFAGWWWYSSHKAAQDRVATAEGKIPRAREEATAADAAKYAPQDLSLAQATEKEGADAKAAGDLVLAATKLEDAAQLYGKAATKADKAKQNETLNALQRALAEKGKQEQQQSVARTKELEEVQKKKTDADAARVKELEAKLAAAKTVADMKPLVDAALASNKIPEIEKAIVTVTEKSKGPADQGGGDPQLASWLKDLQKRVDDLKAIPKKLDAAADASKPVAVAVQTTVYAMPKGQNEKTSQIRELVAYASGSGFLVAKDKVATTKELVEPWKFDPTALAIAKKWESDFGYTIHSKTDVLLLDSSNTFKEAATTNPETGDPTATVIFKGADAYVDKPIDQVVVFKGATSTVSVNPHRRESGNLAVIQLRTPGSASLPISAADPKPGDQVVVLVQQKDKGSDKSALYSQQTEITNRPGSGDSFLGVGGYNTWTGGAVLNADGQVVGLIDEVQSEWMRMVSPSRIKEAAALDK